MPRFRNTKKKNCNTPKAKADRRDAKEKKQKEKVAAQNRAEELRKQRDQEKAFAKEQRRNERMVA